MRDTGNEVALPPGVRAAIFFLAVFFCFTRDGLSEKGTTRSHDSCDTLRELQPDPTLACRSADTSKAAYYKVTSTTPDAIQLKPAC